MRPIKMLLAQGAWPKGHVIPSMPAAQAQMMVMSGIAEYADNEGPAVSSPVNRMMAPAVVGGSGKKRGRK